MKSNGKQEDIARRFWNKVIKKGQDDCWHWLGTVNTSGYGLFWPTRRKTRTAHSVAFELTYGWIPDNTHHKCWNKLCCNPRHLMGLSIEDHAKHSDKYLQDHCIHGHEYTETNTYIKPNGCRDCKECRRNRNRQSSRQRRYDKALTE